MCVWTVGAMPAAPGRGPGSRVPGSETAAAAGDGAAQRLPEQDQDADGGAARPRAAQAGAEGVAAPRSPGTKGERLTRVGWAGGGARSRARGRG